MLKIYETVVRALHKECPNPTEEFKKGAELVLKLFEIGIKKANHYNANLALRELSIENRKQKGTIEQLRKEIANKQEKIFELSLISGEPSNKFIVFQVPVHGHSTDVEIVTNMDVETFKLCLYNFDRKHTFKRPDEAKSKLLTFINSKRYLGFYAYKDWKTYRKEHLNKQK